MRVVVVGGGVVGVACALALARREGVDVELREAREALGLAASGTNSGILHTGFDSKPGELETELILRAAALRPPLLDALGVPFDRRGALLRPRSSDDEATIASLHANAINNGVEVWLDADGALEVPGEGMTDPVAFTHALAGAAVEHGARLALASPVTAPLPDADLVVNAAGLGAGRVARLFGDDSFDVFPRKGEFFVFDVAPPARILLPVPTARTKGVLVFPTLDGRTVAGPTAVDLAAEDEDWTVRPQARDEILAKAVAMYPALDGAEPVFSYAGLRPAGADGANYVVRRSEADARVIHAAAIRSTGLTAAVAIAERVVALAGLGDAPEAELLRGAPWARPDVPWWRRTADRLAAS